MYYVTSRKEGSEMNTGVVYWRFFCSFLFCVLFRLLSGVLAICLFGHVLFFVMSDDVPL
jgi:hypothetical protein